MSLGGKKPGALDPGVAGGENQEEIMFFLGIHGISVTSFLQRIPATVPKEGSSK